MRKIISDFDFTVLLPLSIVAVVFLCISVRRYIAVILSLRRAAEWRSVHKESDTDQGKIEFAEWQQAKKTDRRLSGLLALFSAIATTLLFGFLFLGDRIKLEIIQPIWSALWFLSFLAFFGGLIASCVYAYRRERLNFALALLVMPLAAASTEHFIHQKWNTAHVLCPNCADSDSEN